MVNLQNKNSCPAKAAEKTPCKGSCGGKLSKCCLLCPMFDFKKNYHKPQLIKKITLNLKVKKTFHAQVIDKIEIIIFQKHFLPMQKHNDLFELKFNLFKLKSWGNRVSVNLLSGGMPLVHRNPYPILYHDQLDFAALFCNEHLKTLFILLLQLNKTRSISLVVQEQSNIGCVHIYDVTYSLKYCGSLCCMLIIVSQFYQILIIL